MPKLLEIAGLSIQLAFRSIRHLHLRVCPPDAQLRVSAPRGMKLEYIRAFILSRLDWIERQRAEILAQAECQKLRDMAVSHVWGKPCQLRLHPNSGRNLVRLEDGELHLYARNAEQKQFEKLLADWHRQQLLEPARERLAFWSEQLALSDIDLGFRKMKSRWGSCAPYKKRIVLNTELVTKPPVCLNYVVAHEMAHFFVPNHGENFRKFMDRLIPDWSQIRKMLNSRQ